MPRPSFDKSVFVNCPFDSEYVPLLRPLLFTIIYLGFSPRIALEASDSGQPRITKIISLIKASKYAIHDLSRLRATKVGEYFRLNMPFELGVDIGCRLFKGGHWSRKKCLILEAEPYRYQAAISDLSNSDIGVHKNEPREVVNEVRKWLNNQCRLSAPGAAGIWGAFIDFMTDNTVALKARGYSEEDIDGLSIPELIADMRGWVRRNSE